MSPSTTQPALQHVKHWGPELSQALLAAPWRLVVPQTTDAFLVKLLAHTPSLGVAILVYSPAHAAVLFEALSAPTLFRRLGSSSGLSQQSLGEQDEKSRWHMVVGALGRAMEAPGSRGLDVGGDMSRWEASLNLSYPCAGMPGGNAHLKLSLEALSPGESAEALASHVVSPMMGCLAALTRGGAAAGGEVDEAIKAQGEKLSGATDTNLACLEAFFAPRTDGKGRALAAGGEILSGFSQAAFGLAPVSAPSPMAEDDEELVLASPKVTKKEPSRTPSLSASLSPETSLARLPKASPGLPYGNAKSPSPRPSPPPGPSKPPRKRFGRSASDSSSDDDDDDMVLAASGRPAPTQEDTGRSSVDRRSNGSASDDDEIVMGGGGGRQPARRDSEEGNLSCPASPHAEPEAARSQGSGTESEEEAPLPLKSTQLRAGRIGTHASSYDAGDGPNMFSSASLAPDDLLDDAFSGVPASRTVTRAGTNDVDLSATLDEDDIRGGTGKVTKAEEWKPAREVVRTQTEAATLAALAAKKKVQGEGGSKRARGESFDEDEDGDGAGVPPPAPAASTSTSTAPARGRGTYKRGMARRGRF